MKRQQADELKMTFTQEEFDTAFQLERPGIKAAPDLQRIRELHDRMRHFQMELKELRIRVNDFLSRWM